MSFTEKDFRCYRPGQSLAEAFPEDEVPLLLMEHLRQMDFMISCGSSYELTAYSFLIQLMTNENLRPLREREHLAVLLNEEGAIVRAGDLWRLYFRPEAEEKRSLPLDAELLPVYQWLMKEYENGEICRIDIPVETMISAVLRRTRISILDEYCRQYPGGYLAVAQKIVREGTDELFANVSVCRYGALSTVDREEMENYRSIKSLLDDYIYQFDHRTGDEPIQLLSIAVFGAPGSGKSFGVKQLAKSCGRFHTATLNLSQFENAEELFAALSQALQTDAEQIPLVFFDEFDSAFRGVSRGWLKLLLAPMQDGEYMLDGKNCRIDRAVFVFAGGTASTFQEFLPQTREEEPAFKAIKGPDFISRLKGTLSIKGPNPSDITDHTFIIRRALLLRDMLLRKFPGIYDRETGCVSISEGLLSALLRVSEYRHGTRSIEFILAMSRLSGIQYYTSSCLPMPEQLDIHLDITDFSRKLMFEQIVGGMTERYARYAHEAHIRNSRTADNGTGRDPASAAWEDLAEYDKENYRDQFRYFVERWIADEHGIHIRPILPDRTGVISELYGSALENAAKAEHERLSHRMRSDGWRQGGVYNTRLQISPELVAYEELPESRRDELRITVRDLPVILGKIGFELVRECK